MRVGQAERPGRTGPGRPSDARERLVRAATSWIFAHSYAAASVDELCAQAGVGKSSFYHFFPSKHDLALAALDHYWAWYQRRHLAPTFAEDVPPEERVGRLFELAYASQRAVRDAAGHLSGCMVGNMALEMGAQDEAIRAKVDGILAEWTGYFERALREAVDTEASPWVDVPLAARALLAYLEGVMLLAKAHNDPELIKRLSIGVRPLSLLGSDTSPP